MNISQNTRLITLGCAVALIGCAQLGLAPAKSLDDKLAYANGVYQAIESTAAAAVRGGSLTPADGTTLLGLGDNARALLDAAQAAEAAGDAAGANSRLALATTVLEQIQNYLTAKGVK